MHISPFSTALEALALRWHRTHDDDVPSPDVTMVPLETASALMFDEHMLRDIGLADGIYHRRHNPVDD